MTSLEGLETSVDLEASSVDLETSSVDLETSSVDLEASLVDLEASLVDLETSSVDLETSSFAVALWGIASRFVNTVGFLASYQNLFRGKFYYIVLMLNVSIEYVYYFKSYFRGF